MSANRLYIFVDESGNPSTGNYYTLAATWCVSERNSPNRVLEPTSDKCLTAVDAGASELKGTKLSEDELDQLHSVVETYAYSDPTIGYGGQIWDEQIPIRHTLYSTPPDVARSAIEQISSTANFTEAFQAVALTAVLDPLFHLSSSRLSAVAEIELVLDATTWRNASQRVHSTIGDFDRALYELLSVGTADSCAVPGIQLSDITAYTWARNRRTGGCVDAVDRIGSRRFESV